MKVYILSIKNEKTHKKTRNGSCPRPCFFKISLVCRQHIFSASFAPPRIWKWRCFTVWQASSPQLEITL